MNSSIEIAEAIKLVEKLIDRTREGRLTWESVPDSMSAESVAKVFTTTLEGNLKATVSCGQRGREASYEQAEQLAFSLVEFDPQRLSMLSILASETLAPDKVVLSVSVEKDPSFGYDTTEEKHLARLLIDLYGLARRSALKVAGSVEKALTYLDRLAG
jgi:hypothetical protein